MSSHPSYSSTRRSPRRNDRSSRRRQPSHNKERSGEVSHSRAEGAKKSEKETSLWQKILEFFGGGKKKPTGVRKEPRTSRETSRTKRQAESMPRPAIRKPEVVEVTTPRIYVGNLSFDATEGDLSELFNGVGSVQNVEVVCYRQTQSSKGFAFVQMQTVDEARRAVSELHDKEYMGRKLVVSGAKALEERRTVQSQQPE